MKSLYESLGSGPIGLTEEEIARYLGLCRRICQAKKLFTQYQLPEDKQI